jgi:hypothetical protein
MIFTLKMLFLIYHRRDLRSCGPGGLPAVHAAARGRPAAERGGCGGHAAVGGSGWVAVETPLERALTGGSNDVRMAVAVAVLAEI